MLLGLNSGNLFERHRLFWNAPPPELLGGEWHSLECSRSHAAAGVRHRQRGLVLLASLQELLCQSVRAASVCISCFAMRFFLRRHKLSWVTPL